MEGEIAALAALFLMWGDWEQMPELKKRFSIFYTKAKNLTEQVVENLKEQWKVPDEISNSQLVTALFQICFDCCFRKTLGMQIALCLATVFRKMRLKDPPLCSHWQTVLGSF